MSERFGWFVAMQAMGTGVAWTDDHAEFMLPAPHHIIGDTEMSSEGRPVRSFRVPHFEFTYLNLED